MGVNIIRLPIVWVVLFAALMFAFDATGAPGNVDFPARVPLTVIILMSGGILAGAGVYSFRRAGTTLDPLRTEQATHLVTGGIHTLTRNPVYMGFLTWLLACAIFTGNAINVVLLPVFIALINKLYIIPEERALELLFGGRFVAYRTRVRRWL